MSTHAHASSQPQARRAPRWLWIVIGAVLVWLMLGGGIGLLFGGGSDPRLPVSGVTEVAVRDNDFAPAAIEIPTGTTVTWRWEGNNPHNVVGDDFQSDVQTSGTFAHTFGVPGAYDYQCSLHGGMRGRVVVTEAA